MSDYKPVEPGETYNGVKIIAFSHVDNYRNRRYICTCHCGTDFIAIGRSLKAGRTRSCGCLANKKPRETPGNIKTDYNGHRDVLIRRLFIWHGGLNNV